MLPRSNQIILRPQKEGTSFQPIFLRPRSQSISLRPRASQFIVSPRKSVLTIRPRSSNQTSNSQANKQVFEDDNFINIQPDTIGQEAINRALGVLDSKGWKTSIECPKLDNAHVGMDLCLTSCKNNCDKFSLSEMSKNAKGVFMSDLVNFMRLSNLAYGIIKLPDIAVENDEEE